MIRFSRTQWSLVVGCVTSTSQGHHVRRHDFERVLPAYLGGQHENAS
jgi:hypothetical protein